MKDINCPDSVAMYSYSSKYIPRTLIDWMKFSIRFVTWLFHSLDCNKAIPVYANNDEDDNGQRNPLKMISAIYVTKYDNRPALGNCRAKATNCKFDCASYN